MVTDLPAPAQQRPGLGSPACDAGYTQARAPGKMAAMEILRQALSPHPAAVPLVDAIAVDLATTGDGLTLSYRIHGDIAALRLPAPAAPMRADDLWQHTCCEVFIAVAGAPGYREFNFSPSGAYAAYAFADTRERNRAADPVLAAPLPIAVVKTADRFVLSVVLPNCLLPRGRCCDLGLSVVVEAVDGRLGYWALQHPSAQPDFHHRRAFALTLDIPA